MAAATPGSTFEVIAKKGGEGQHQPICSFIREAKNLCICVPGQNHATWPPLKASPPVYCRQAEEKGLGNEGCVRHYKIAAVNVVCTLVSS